MRVTHETDLITHAVVGGSDPIAMGITDNAEFFHMFSSSLYRDQLLAMVREVLCNSWDAHIEANKQHVPVEVKITNKEISFKDFGNGIPHDMIGEIYGIYGESTKRKQKNQTGGFGLGSKSPYAYTDNFEVISCSGGTKTIYRMSKSAPETGGKPAIIPITSLPTNETGLTVTIPIKDVEDFRRLDAIVRDVTRNGEMNVVLVNESDKPLPMYPFSKGRGFLYVNQSPLDSYDNAIFIKYGTVIYPVSDTEEIREEYRELRNKFLSLFPYHERSRVWKLILEAPPNSISVTPSRESLSMQEKTIKTIKRLFNNHIEILEKEAEKAREEVLKRIIDKAIDQKAMSILLNYEGRYPNIDNHWGDGESKTFINFDEISEYTLQNSYPTTVNVEKFDRNYRVQRMIEEGLIDKGLGYSWLKANKNNHNNAHALWFRKKILQKLTSGFHENQMNPQNLRILQVKGLQFYVERVDWREDFYNFRRTMSFLTKTIIISTRMGKIEEALFDARKDHPWMEMCFVPMYVERKVKQYKQAIKYFREKGYTVIDLKKYYPKKEKKPSNRPKRKVFRGLVRMDTKGVITTSNPDRTTEPEHIAHYSTYTEHSSLHSTFGRNLSNWVIEKFGATGGYAFSQQQYENYIKKGAIGTCSYVARKVAEELEKNPKYLKYFEVCPKKAMDKMAPIRRYTFNRIMGVIEQFQEIRDLFDIEHDLTEEEMKYVEAYYKLMHFPELSKVHEKISEIPISKNFDKISALSSNYLVKVLFENIDIYHITNNEDIQKKYLEMVKVLLN